VTTFAIASAIAATQLERGGRGDTPEPLAKIARALGCLVGDLLEVGQHGRLGRQIASR
jgi:hypothetical protein